MQCFVKGFRYYSGPSLLNATSEADMLELVREPDNTCNSFAIALHWNDHKIGFIHRKEKNLFSKFLDAGVLEIHTEITYLKPEAETWENVSISIYLLKEICDSLPTHANHSLHPKRLDTTL
ncbi:MAG: HIRAN domain-containing protein [Chitinophagales bacterium]|nr:HIRAN domain-containing protein [Chitinophagales bacterium]